MQTRQQLDEKIGKLSWPNNYLQLSQFYGVIIGSRDEIVDYFQQNLGALDQYEQVVGPLKKQLTWLPDKIYEVMEVDLSNPDSFYSDMLYDYEDHVGILLIINFDIKKLMEHYPDFDTLVGDMRAYRQKCGSAAIVIQAEDNSDLIQMLAAHTEFKRNEGHVYQFHDQ